MPRKARIDAAGELQHIIVRGIERRKIFWDDADRDAFEKRLAQVLIETHTDDFAWALILNHASYSIRQEQPAAPKLERRRACLDEALPATYRKFVKNP
jgi:hypothetical protein